MRRSTRTDADQGIRRRPGSLVVPFSSRAPKPHNDWAAIRSSRNSRGSGTSVSVKAVNRESLSNRAVEDCTLKATAWEEVSPHRRLPKEGGQFAAPMARSLVRVEYPGALSRNESRRRRGNFHCKGIEFA